MNTDQISILITSITAVLGVVSLIRNITTDALVAIRFTGIIIMLLSGLFILGYAMGIPELYTWPHGSSAISLPSCFLFFMLGAGKIVTTNRLKRIEDGLERNHIELNGRLDTMLATERRAGHVEGRYQEQNEERQRRESNNIESTNQ